MTVLRYGRGHQFDTTHYLSACEQRIKEHGGDVLTRARAESLLMDEGTVHGARCRLPDGSLRPVEAWWTLLATGGFQGDPVLRAQLIHPQARDLQLRANPHSDGDGLRLGLSAGAAVGKPDAGFYGHLIPAGVPLSDPSMFVDLALYYSEHALLFNLDGERFVDETIGDHITTMALLAQPGARGLLVADAAVYREWIVGSYVEGVPGIDKFALASRRGARRAVAESMEEFGLLPDGWGYPGPKIRAAIQALNRDLSAGGVPSPGRVHDRRVIAEPPFYVIEAAPTITFTFTGLLTDRQMRVRSGVGGLVPGLLAAGADVGGLYDRAYAGGLAPALVFGLTAARTAVTRADRRRHDRDVLGEGRHLRAVLRGGGQVRRGQAHPLQQHQGRLHHSLPGGVQVHGGHDRLPSPEAGACACSAWSTTAKEHAASMSWPGEAASNTWSPVRSPQRRRSAAGITT